MSEREPDLTQARDLAMELMAIPGKSGEEAEVSRYVTGKLRAAGVPAEIIAIDRVQRRTPLSGDTGNLILKLQGTRRGARRLLAGHLDTVPICVGSKPLLRGRVVRSASRGTGLGADNRAACAVLLATALEIVERGLPHPPVTFCWFVQEEVGLQGSQRVSKASLGNPRLAFNWDGGGAARLVVGATGAYRIHIEVGGVASHAGSAPERGVSAIAIAARAIAVLDRAGWHGKVEKEEGSGTSNVGVIQAGEATNVVSDRTIVRAEARSHDPAFRRRIVREFEQAFRRAAARAIKRRRRDRPRKGVDHPGLRVVQAAAQRTVRACGRGRGRKFRREPGVPHRRRRTGRQLAHRPGYPDGHHGRRPAQRPHHQRNPGSGRLRTGLSDGVAAGHRHRVPRLSAETGWATRFAAPRAAPNVPLLGRAAAPRSGGDPRFDLAHYLNQGRPAVAVGGPGAL